MRHSRSLTYALAVVTAALSCGDPGAPEPPALVIDASMTTMVVVPEPDGWPQAVCDINIHVVAGNKPAKLVAGLWKFFTGTARSAPTNTYDVDLDELAYVFGNDTIAAGDTVEGEWGANNGFPFEIQLVLRFNTGAGEVIAQSDKVSCGPPAPTPVPSLPTLSQVALSPTGGVVVGQSLWLNYSAAGTKLWATEAVFFGAFSHVTIKSEGMIPQTTAQFWYPVPAGASAGAAVNATVWSFDALGQYVTAQASTGPVLAPVPPTLTAKAGPSWSLHSPSLRGNFFTDDTLSVLMQATDGRNLSLGVRRPTDPRPDRAKGKAIPRPARARP